MARGPWVELLTPYNFQRNPSNKEIKSELDEHRLLYNLRRFLVNRPITIWGVRADCWGMWGAGDHTGIKLP